MDLSSFSNQPHAPLNKFGIDWHLIHTRDENVSSYRLVVYATITMCVQNSTFAAIFSAMCLISCHRPQDGKKTSCPAIFTPHVTSAHLPPLIIPTLTIQHHSLSCSHVTFKTLLPTNATIIYILAIPCQFLYARDLPAHSATFVSVPYTQISKCTTEKYSQCGPTIKGARRHLPDFTCCEL